MKGRLAHRLTGRWVRLPRRTIRLRLTLVYGGLFLVSGAGLLGITYGLAAHQYSRNFFLSTGNGGVAKVVIAQGSIGATQKGSVAGPVGLPVSILAPPSKGVVIAAADAQSVAARHQLLIQSGIALAIMAFLSIWLGWVVAGRALRPLRTITNAARQISASNLHRRLALSGPDDELRQLGRTFDDLLARLERSFEAQRQFVANASHELRTPLTLERVLLEVALADPDATVEQLRQTCEKVLAAGAQQERLIEALLTLSRSQRGVDRPEPVDLAALAAASVESVEHDGLTVVTTLAPARTSGDARLVELLVANLVANAVCHNVPGGRVEVATATRDGRAVVTVANTGPVVPAGQLPRLFEPFQRLDGGRGSGADGLGLGLSIVQAIAAAHEAPVAARPRDGGGLDVEVSFAAAAPEPAPRRRPAVAAV